MHIIWQGYSLPLSHLIFLKHAHTHTHTIDFCSEIALHLKRTLNITMLIEGMWRKTENQLCYSIWATWFTRIFETDWWICRSCFIHSWSWRFVLIQIFSSPMVLFLCFPYKYPWRCHAGYARPLFDKIDVENRFLLRLYRPSTVST